MLQKTSPTFFTLLSRECMTENGHSSLDLLWFCSSWAHTIWLKWCSWESLRLVALGGWISCSIPCQLSILGDVLQPERTAILQTWQLGLPMYTLARHWGKGHAWRDRSLGSHPKGGTAHLKLGMCHTGSCWLSFLSWLCRSLHLLWKTDVLSF